jgi:hypothetical protein
MFPLGETPIGTLFFFYFFTHIVYREGIVTMEGINIGF